MVLAPCAASPSPDRSDSPTARLGSELHRRGTEMMKRREERLEQLRQEKAAQEVAEMRPTPLRQEDGRERRTCREGGSDDCEATRGTLSVYNTNAEWEKQRQRRLAQMRRRTQLEEANAINTAQNMSVMSQKSRALVEKMKGRKTYVGVVSGWRQRVEAGERAKEGLRQHNQLPFAPLVCAKSAEIAARRREQLENGTHRSFSGATGAVENDAAPANVRSQAQVEEHLRKMDDYSRQKQRHLAKLRRMHEQESGSQCTYRPVTSANSMKIVQRLEPEKRLTLVERQELLLARQREAEEMALMFELEAEDRRRRTLGLDCASSSTGSVSGRNSRAFLARVEQQQRQREEKISRLALEKANNDAAQCTFSPQVCKKSMQLAKHFDPLKVDIDDGGRFSPSGEDEHNGTRDDLYIPAGCAFETEAACDYGSTEDGDERYLHDDLDVFSDEEEEEEEEYLCPNMGLEHRQHVLPPRVKVGTLSLHALDDDRSSGTRPPVSHPNNSSNHPPSSTDRKTVRSREGFPVGGNFESMYADTDSLVDELLFKAPPEARARAPMPRSEPSRLTATEFRVASHSTTRGVSANADVSDVLRDVDEFLSSVDRLADL